MRNRFNRPRPASKPLVTASFAALALLLVWLARGPATLFETESEFGRVRVVERSDGLRSLYIDNGHARQTALYPDRPMHLELAYTRVATIGLALVPPDARLLYVGLGGGAMPTHARRALPAADIDVVEIDPVVVDVARHWFAFAPDAQLRVHTDDGRAFIERAPPDSWDLIVLDAFSDNAIPYALTTRQFLEAVQRSLAPSGFVTANLFTSSPAYAAMLATYEAVFEQVHLIHVPRHRQVILVASNTVPPLDRAMIGKAARELAARIDLGFDLVELVEHGYELPAAAGAPVLEDEAG